MAKLTRPLHYVKLMLCAFRVSSPLKTMKYYNWLEQLPNNIQVKILEKMTEQALVDGEALFHIGDSSNALYQVLSGKIKCNIYSHDGKEVVISTLMTSETFGEQGVLDGLPRATNVYSVGNSIVRALNKKSFNKLCQQHPEINAQLLVMFSHRMRMAFEINTDNLTLPLYQRLSRCLYRIAVSNSVNGGDDEAIFVDLLHEELARMVGASRQSVSKALKQMERENVLQIQYGTIVINHIGKLKAAYYAIN